jgi:hypothetical protein
MRAAQAVAPCFVTPKLGAARVVGLFVLGAVVSLSLTLTACGGSVDRRITAISAARLARWTRTSQVRRVVDLGVLPGNGDIVLAAAARLGLLRRAAGRPVPFATGAGGYLSPGGEEPYLAVSTGERVDSANCAFSSGSLYALRLVKGPGVTIVDAQGTARRFADLAGRGLENGIAFDDTGRFGHRLLVTATSGSKTTVYAIDCRGKVVTVTQTAPKVEGGIAVAPSTFGAFAGDLIAPDENSGRIYAIAPDGVSRLVADAGLPRGGDVGVDSLGFAPSRFGPAWSALVADRRTPGNPHPGDDAVLRIGGRSLVAAGVRPGDLLASTEGGAQTDAISCGTSCRVRRVADGPPAAHLEGHIVFRRGG